MFVRIPEVEEKACEAEKVWLKIYHNFSDLGKKIYYV